MKCALRVSDGEMETKRDIEGAHTGLRDELLVLLGQSLERLSFLHVN